MSRRLTILPFRLGLAAAETLGPEVIDFYRNTARAVVSEQCDDDLSRGIRTVPLDARTLSETPSRIASDLAMRLGKITSPDVVLVDLANPPFRGLRGQLELHIAIAIDGFFSAHESNEQSVPSGTVILLLRELPPLQDASRRILERWIKDGAVVVIADNGEILCQENMSAQFQEERYRLGLLRMRGNPSALLRLKLIRRLGHFKRMRGDVHVRCVRYFFDGRRAAKEIKAPFGQFVEDTFPGEVLVAVLLDEGMSDWIVEPIVSFCLDSEVAFYPLRKGSMSQDLKELSAEHLLFVTPLVDTGQTILDLIEELADHFDHSRFSVFAVLSTEGDSPTLGHRALKAGGINISVPYLIRVEQRSFPAGECPLCAIGFSDDNPSDPEHLMLTSYDFWDMVEDAGIGPETNVPADVRNGKKAVPQFDRMIESHGSWLAQKIVNIIEMATDRNIRDTVVISPADEAASEALTAYLTFVAGASVIPIPREVIRHFYSADTQAIKEIRRQWRAERPEWHERLTSALVPDLVILDEFIESGSTVHTTLSLPRAEASESGWTPPLPSAEA